MIRVKKFRYSSINRNITKRYFLLNNRSVLHVKYTLFRYTYYKFYYVEFLKDPEVGKIKGEKVMLRNSEGR